MPNDNTETYEEALRPLADKIGRVCKAFKMPFALVIQVADDEERTLIRGEMFTPPGTTINILAGAYLTQAQDTADLETRVLALAEYLLKKHLQGLTTEEAKDLFEELQRTLGAKSEGGDTKVLN